MKTLRKTLFGLVLGISLLCSTAVTTFAYEWETDDASDEEGTVETGDESPAGQVTQPVIPLPSFLPSPDVGERGYDTQNYLLNETIPRGINIVIGLFGIATFIGILVASIQMLTAYGNEDKINRAKTSLRYGIIGFLLSILSYGIVSIVVSVALPNNDDHDADTAFFSIPSAYAVDIEDDLDILLPSQQTIIEDQDPDKRVSLPGGDFLGEIVPAVITNALYVTAFLIFIAFMYGGVLLVIGRGNEEATTKAKSIIIYSGVALVLLSLGYAIVYGIANLNLTDNEDTEIDEVFNNREDSND
ncbi:MAG: hypothetical protein AAB383_01650 [Patescibacteria group bacterium]